MKEETKKKLLKLVSDNYEDIAAEFSATRQGRPWPEILELAKIKDITDKKILDVGCGNGRLLELFPEQTFSYLGIDQSAKLISLAREKYPDRDFRPGDCLDLGKFPEISFDLVFSIAVFHHLPGADRRLAALKQLKNKVAPDGRIIISVWNLWARPKFRRLIRKFFLLKLIGKNEMDPGDIIFNWKNNPNEPAKQRYYHAFTKGQLRRLARKAGLKVETLAKDKNNYYLILKK